MQEINFKSNMQKCFNISEDLKQYSFDDMLYIEKKQSFEFFKFIKNEFNGYVKSPDYIVKIMGDRMLFKFNNL